MGIRPNKDILTCKEPGKCSIDEVEERPTGSEFVDDQYLQNDYWKRAAGGTSTRTTRFRRSTFKKALNRGGGEGGGNTRCLLVENG